LNQLNFPEYSVVIATLGGSTLQQTLNCINSNSVIPKEILICIPPNEKNNVAHLEGGNIKILITATRGQVAQRAEGFEHSTGNVIIQMDDDVVFKSTVIKNLMTLLLQLGPKHVVGPVFCDEVNNKPIARFNIGLKGFFKNLYFTCVAGLPWGLRRMGAYSVSTCAISVDPEFAKKPLHAVQWLAGGFVIGFREDLVLEKFYPLPGKAYCEDLLHAQYRSKKGVQHMVASNVMVSTKPQDDHITLSELKRELKVRRLIAKKLGANSISTSFFMIIELLRRRFKARV
jgi:hypothetical protein